jgi:hypothetical protein
MDNMQTHEKAQRFGFLVMDRIRRGEGRGSALLNSLIELDPDLASTIVGTDNDPTQNPDCFASFNKILQTAWYLK